MDALTFLTIIGRVPPQAWDAIFPHGPAAKLDRFSLAALNPQPLPPEPPPEQQFVIAAAHMARHYVQLAVDADVRGEDPNAWFPELVRDWCITGWPPKIPIPVPPSEGGPLPDPWVLDAGRMVGAVVLASHADRLTGGRVQPLLVDGARQLLEASEHG